MKNYAVQNYRNFKFIFSVWRIKNVSYSLYSFEKLQPELIEEFGGCYKTTTLSKKNNYY